MEQQRVPLAILLSNVVGLHKRLDITPNPVGPPTIPGDVAGDLYEELTEYLNKLPDGAKVEIRHSFGQEGKAIRLKVWLLRGGQLTFDFDRLYS